MNEEDERDIGGLKNGLTRNEKIVGGLISLGLGLLHWIPSPGVADITKKVDELKLSVETLTTNVAVITNTLESDKGELIDHEMRLRSLQTEEDKRHD